MGCTPWVYTHTRFVLLFTLHTHTHTRTKKQTHTRTHTHTHRYGGPYLQGVAASILAYADTPAEVRGRR